MHPGAAAYGSARRKCRDYMSAVSGVIAADSKSANAGFGRLLTIEATMQL
jgi:hypothetical protein